MDPVGAAGVTARGRGDPQPAGAGSSRIPQGEPYSTSRSRNGFGANASGPRTPAPDHVPRGQQLQRHDRVDRRLPDHRLRAVLGHRPVVVDHVVQVDRARRAVLAAARDPGAGAGLAVHPVAQAGRVREAGGHDVARRDRHALDRHRLGAVEAERVQHLEDVDELVAQAVLEGDPLGLDPARDQEHLLVLHVHALDRADPLRELERLGLAERRRGVPAAALLPDDRRVEALLDRRPDARTTGAKS